LDEAIRLDPKNITAYNNRGFAYRLKADYDRAIRDLDEAIKLDPKNVVAYNNRGIAYGRKGEHDRAIRDYDEAIRINPNHAEAYANRGVAYREKGDDERAMVDVSEAIRIDPKISSPYTLRGLLFEKMGQHDRATSDYNEAFRLADETIKTNPKRETAYNTRGLVYNQRAQYDQAIADLNEAIRLFPTYPQAFKNRGISFEGKGDLRRALADFREALRLWPTNRDALDGLKRVEQTLAAADPSPVPPLAASQQRRVALVIGNGDYRHAAKLANPTNDAADIAQALRRLGFEVVEGRDLDKRAMEDKVREFGRKLDRADLALFFYAGHGIQVGGKNYLIPVDGKLERAGDLNFETFDISFILGQMEADQRVNLVFLDACRDNPLTRSFARSLGTRSTSVGQGLATIQSAIGTLIAFATQPDAVAHDGEGRNSPFTAALLKHLSTPGLEIGAVMRRVRADVIAETRQKQVPWDHSSLVGEVILAR
jgi:tetratricopeptide (TPR) repeat protein